MFVTGILDLGADRSAGDSSEATAEGGEEDAAADSFALVVNDDDCCLRVLRALVELTGNRCLTARSGHDALASCEEVGPPRFVVTDWNMPGLDGEVLARRLKDRFPDLPIVLVTGRDADEVPRESRHSLFAAVLTKPLDPAAFARVLSALPVAADASSKPEGTG